MTLEQKLDKCRKTISNHVARGNLIPQRRSFELIDRFEELKEQAIKEGVWVK